MKYYNNIVIASIIICLSPYLQSQTKSNKFVVWTVGGLSRIMNTASNINVVNNSGTSFGAGYELHYNHFIFQTGVEVLSNKSKMTISDTIFSTRMTDTEGDSYDGLFSFKDICDKQRMINLGIPLLFGYSSKVSGFYFLTGGKVQLNLYGRSSTHSLVTTQAIYDKIIGEDGCGLISNMPNHGLSTENRIVKNSFKLNTAYAGTFEVGYSLQKIARKDVANHLRIALLYDFGIFTINANQKTNQLVVNTELTGEFKPTIGSLIFNNISTNRIATLYFGIKLYYIFNLVPENDCKCESFRNAH